MNEPINFDWFDDQIRQRKIQDDELFADALINMTGAVLGDKIATALKDDRQVTKNAIAEVLKYYHLKAGELPDNIQDPQAQLEYLCRPHGIMRRTVKLSKGWYNDAVGPMLGILKESGSLVSLLPKKSRIGYTFFDVESGKRRDVNANTETLFDTEAICFYKPFPLKQIGIPDLIRYMIETFTFADLVPVILTMLFSLAIGMMMPKLYHALYSDVLDSGNFRVLAGAAVFLISLTISTTLLNSIKSLLMSRMTTKLTVNVEAAAMMRVLSLPADFFKNYNSGELSQRIQYIGSLCQSMLDMALSTGLTSIFSLAYITQIFRFAPALVVPALIITFITLLFTLVSTFLRMQESRESMALAAKESGLTHSLITGVQKIRLSGSEKRIFAKWANNYSKSIRFEYNPILFLKIGTVISQAISLIGMIVMYAAALSSGISQADYLAFQSAYGMVSAAFLSLAGIASQLAQIKPILEMVEPFLKTLPEMSENKQVVEKLAGGIELSHVDFRYTENMPLVLDDLSIKIRPKQYIAIVGKTGCGKSTLMRLLLGFEKPKKGAVYYDGRDIEQLDLKSLRQNIGSVMQNGKLFMGSIYENIVISAPWLTLEEAWQAAETAGIADDIRAMPMGMQTIISEGSGGISGGQKQRLLIARAIAPKPKVLIFDEATSALDNMTQKKVSDALDQLKCTRIVIAHRLSTIRQCDRILVLDKGKIIEDGTYDELIALGGFFADLVERQRVDI
ncbi:MAG: ATP-binding cassette domain-containing protein [Lachnospiraceae bacterium]|nr:ATP-binding cassette domain-containing protein [Lachnospiraceae bacterium]